MSQWREDEENVYRKRWTAQYEEVVFSYTSSPSRVCQDTCNSRSGLPLGKLSLLLSECVLV
jgi:hypothetical protein